MENLVMIHVKDKSINDLCKKRIRLRNVTEINLNLLTPGTTRKTLGRICNLLYIIGLLYCMRLMIVQIV